MKTIIRTQKGFSLIELMVVVAIIGVLAAIAIPNFTRFQRKARQSEATALLTSYYTAARASMAELGNNPGNFVAIGFQPEGSISYRVTAADGGNPPAGQPNDDACIVTTAACNAWAGYTPTWTERAGFAAAPAGTCAAANGGTTFTTCASATLGGTNTDTWNITQTKALTNSTSGL